MILKSTTCSKIDTQLIRQHAGADAVSATGYRFHRSYAFEGRDRAAELVRA